LVSYNTHNELENYFDFGPGYEYCETILLIVIQFIIKDPSYFINGIDKNGKSIIRSFLDTVPRLLYFSKDSEDETFFLLLVKTLIVVVETFYPADALNDYLPAILDIVVNEIKNATSISFKCFLLQAVN